MHRPDLIDWADAYFLPEGCLKRKTFGCPSYYLGKKMAAFVHEDSLVIKLPVERVQEMIDANADVYCVFAPMGQPMSSWLTITYPEAGEYDEVRSLIEEGMNFVATDTKPKKPKKNAR